MTRNVRSLKTWLLLSTILIGGITVSALTLPDSILIPLKINSEGSILSKWITPTAPRLVEDVPSVNTDKDDYAPYETVQISGSGFRPNESVTLLVVHIYPQSLAKSSTTSNIYDHAGHTPWQVLVGPDGTFSSSWLVQEDSLNQTLLLTADQGAIGESIPARHAEKVFTDANPSADLDQCENGQFPSPSTDGCDADAADWVNGNLGESKSVYFEGDSIPYRLKMDNLPLSSHTVVIEWDTTKSSKHAIDYLTTFNRTVGTANPCLGVSGCNAGTFTTFGIPADGQVTGAGVTPIAGLFRMYGGTITGVSAYSYPDGTGFSGDKSARISITFTASVANPVLAWGGHIATRQNWGSGGSAVAISGSPYHTRLISLDGSGGNQDRSLSAAAVIFPGSITIIKQANPESSQSFAFTASPSPLANFSLVDDGDDANTPFNAKVFSNITDFQTYSINETPVPSGWSFISLSCAVDVPNGGDLNVVGSVATIDLAEGENVTCTYNNSGDSVTKGKIKIVKVTQPNPDPTNTDFTFSPTNFILSDTTLKNGEDVTSGFLTPTGSGVDIYSVTEGSVSGWVSNGGSCDRGTPANITVVAGQTTTCTFTNSLLPKLTVIKHVVNDNGGTKTAGDFSMHVKTGGSDIAGSPQAGSETGTTYTLNPGTYVASEDIPPSGYSQTGITGSCNGSGSVTLAYGDDVTCTITNNDQPGKLIVVKHVINDNGGNKNASDFTMSVTGSSPSPASFAGAESPGTDVSINAGSYSVGETGPSGYTASFSADCSGSIASGQTKTCTVTNDDQAAKLIVIKHVINDNGGTATAANFTLDSGGAADTPDNFPGAESPGTEVTLDAGAYNVSESGPTGYTASFSADCSGSIANGQTKTCTVTNDDQAAKLIVIKHVINDNGGTATAADFTLDSGGANDSPDNFPGAESPGTDVSLDAGAYNVTESGPSGYTASFSAYCSGTIANGQTKTCTVTNDDQAAKLIVIKHVINDNGGTATAANFTLDSGGANDSPDNFAGAESPGTEVTLDAGAYNVTETGPSGYTASFSADCSGSIANGQTKTCTVTNDDQAAKLIVIKHVINNNGGSATAANFTLDSGGTNDSPDNFAGAESPGTEVTLDAGSYNVTESGPSGYTASFSAYCSGTIANGQTKTCTVTNDDQPGTLIVKKIVINDNGGTKIATDFSFKVNGGTAVAFLQDGSDTLKGKNTLTVNANVYSVTEPAVYGYTTTYDNCSNVSVGNGLTQTCTVTNDDQPGTIVVIKNAQPAQGSFAFTTTGSGYNGFTLTGATTNDGNKNSQNLNVGTYTVKEGTQLGWLLTGIGGSKDANTPYNCVVTGSGGSTGVGNLNTQTATIDLKNGDTVTCSFDNTGNGATRTQGFWATHSQLANIAWFGGSAYGHTFPGVAGVAGIGDTTICGKPIDTLGKLMGGFWSDIAKLSNGKKRSASGQSKMQLLQQLLAAELNGSAFGSVPSGGTGSYATWETALCTGSNSQIQNAQQGAASFNSIGDSSTFTPGTSADSKTGRAIANIAFWDFFN